MAFDPAPFNLMSCRGHHMVQRLPQLHILDGLLGGRPPAFGLPAMDPFGDAFANVFAVQVKRHLAWPLEGFQALDHGGQFHAVVGGTQLAAKKFMNVLARLQANPPATGARIAFAGTICINFNVIQQLSFEAVWRLMEVSERATGTVVAAGDRTARHGRPSSQRPPGTLLVARIK